MSVKQRARQAGVELPLVISDHADWNELRQTITETGAEKVWVTHGREDALVYWCQQQGLEAEPLNIDAYEDAGEGGGRMRRFAQLLELLALTPSRNRKLEALIEYFRETPDPDRGYRARHPHRRADLQERQAGGAARRGAGARSIRTCSP